MEFKGIKKIGKGIVTVAKKVENAPKVIRHAGSLVVDTTKAISKKKGKELVKDAKTAQRAASVAAAKSSKDVTDLVRKQGADATLYHNAQKLLRLWLDELVKLIDDAKQAAQARRAAYLNAVTANKYSPRYLKRLQNQADTAEANIEVVKRQAHDRLKLKDYLELLTKYKDLLRPTYEQGLQAVDNARKVNTLMQDDLTSAAKKLADAEAALKWGSRIRHTGYGLGAIGAGTGLYYGVPMVAGAATGLYNGFGQLYNNSKNAVSNNVANPFGIFGTDSSESQTLNTGNSTSLNNRQGGGWLLTPEELIRYALTGLGPLSQYIADNLYIGDSPEAIGRRALLVFGNSSISGQDLYTNI